MKKIQYLLLAIACLFTASCHKDTGTAKVHVNVNDFSISQEDMSKSSENVADYTGVKAITLAFYTSDGTEQYKTTQMRADASTYTTFGHFDLSLPMGSYTMVVLGYGLNDGEPAITLTSPTSATFGNNPARETFVATQSVNIANANDEVDISATLSRVISKLKIHSTDGCTENAVNVRTTLSAGGKSFNPTTGLATSNTGFVNTLPIQSTVGNPTNSITYLFLATDEQTVNVTIDVLDANGNSISHKVVANVPFKRNRQTVLSGSIYSAGVSGDFTVDTSWLDDYNMDF